MKGSDSVFEKTLGSDPAMVTHSAESLAVEGRCECVYPPHPNHHHHQPMFRRDAALTLLIAVYPALRT